MKKATYVLIALAVAAVALVITGCGTKVDGVPGTVATVNGESINADEYLAQVSRTAGQQVLRGMIEQSLMVQWAAKEKVPVTDEQVNAQLEAIKRSGEYDDRAKAVGENGVEKQLLVEQAVTNLSKKFYKISNDDLKNAYDANQSNFKHGPRKRIGLILTDDKKKADEAAKKLKDGEDLNEVGAQYSANNPFGQSGPIEAWVDPEMQGLPTPLAKAIKDTKVGGISKVFELPSGTDTKNYGVIKILKEQDEVDLEPKDVKPELEKMVAMRKIQENSEDFQKRLNDWKKKAKIEVNIADFKGIVAGIKNPPPPMMAPTMQPGAPAAP